ncbi:hypothetical protein AAFF_G00213400 [Aldrovandia affinis]|uniref:Uncharacterized protein n=1 Tax=Aldrovandia affinis TaxID=143900 RepID=A0AAD7QZX8_9TELE|nr:hypothetical protein AAFF_G00213400 [Aldrovandia affinis]
MGVSYSAEEEAQFRYDHAVGFYDAKLQTGGFPDVGIDGSLLAHSGLSSTAVLSGYSSELQQRLETNAGAYAKDLGTPLGAFTPVPNAVGLGALLISMVIELALVPQGETSGSSAGLLRRVFAEARNLMDEYAKRHEMFLRDEGRLTEETRRLEPQPSVQLTRLRNSTLLEGHMSSRALRHWVNGAAFHAHMVIRAARLGTGDSAAPSRRQKIPD